MSLCPSFCGYLLRDRCPSCLVLRANRAYIHVANKEVLNTLLTRDILIHLPLPKRYSLCNLWLSSLFTFCSEVFVPTLCILYMQVNNTIKFSKMMHRQILSEEFFGQFYADTFSWLSEQHIPKCLRRRLEKEMATHSSILAGRIPMDRGAWQASVHGVTKSRTQLSG